MNTVHKDDQEIVDILQLNIHNGPWIAGGAVLNWFNDTPVQSDIDVFCRSEAQAKQLLKRITNCTTQEHSRICLSGLHQTQILGSQQ